MLKKKALIKWKADYQFKHISITIFKIKKSRKLKEKCVKEINSGEWPKADKYPTSVSSHSTTTTSWGRADYWGFTNDK